MALAGSAYWLIHILRLIIGKNDRAKVRRAGIDWALDLREGLDLTIYLSGYFQRDVVLSSKAMLQKGDVVVDVGANMGSFALHMAEAVGGNGKVIAIEPTAYPYQRLCENLDLNSGLKERIETYQAFLTANSEGLKPDTIQSSWRLAGVRNGAHPVHLGVPQTTSGARSLTLDQIVEEIDLKRLDFIKIDVDGAEDDVLAGGESVIRKFKPSVLIEVAPYTLTERGLPPDAPLNRLKQLGYSFKSLDGKELRDDDLNKLMALRPGQSKDIIAFNGND